MTLKENNMSEEKEIVEETAELDENALKLEALKAATNSGFLSGFTSAANQLSVKITGKPLTPQEVQFYSQLAGKGIAWYLPKFLESPEGQAIAEVLDIDLGIEEEEESIEE